MDQVIPSLLDVGGRQLQQQQVPGPPAGGNNTNGTIAILVIVVSVFLIIWSPSLVRKCRRWCNRQPYRSDASGRPASDAYLEAAVMSRLSEFYRTRSSRPSRMTESDRREYVANVLLPRRLVLDALSTSKLDGNLSLKVQSPDKADVLSFHLSQPSKHGQLDDDENCCAICLNNYKDGDEVCLSNNKFCSHFFHKNCISEWLITHEECPCCRHYFLFFVENDADLELFEGRRGNVLVGSNHNQRPDEHSPEHRTENATDDREHSRAPMEVNEVTADDNNTLGAGISSEHVPTGQADLGTLTTTTSMPPHRSVTPSGRQPSVAEASSALQRGLGLFESLRRQLPTTQHELSSLEVPPGVADAPSEHNHYLRPADVHEIEA